MESQAIQNRGVYHGAAKGSGSDGVGARKNAMLSYHAVTRSWLNPEFMSMSEICVQSLSKNEVVNQNRN